MRRSMKWSVLSCTALAAISCSTTRIDIERPVIPTELIQPVLWPERQGIITHEQMMEDIRILRRTLIEDNKRKADLQELIEAWNRERDH